MASRVNRFPELAPAVCRAGEFQFAPNQTFTNHCVQSRGLFWCKSGRGAFEVDRHRFTLEPHDLFLLPWNRHISYHAGPREPMFTAHVHLVPWLRPGCPWVPNVPHERHGDLFDSPDRADAKFAGAEGVIRLHIDAEDSLGRLINYTTRWYQDSTREEGEGRALGLLVVQEVKRHLERVGHARTRRPEELNRMLVYIERNLQDAPTVQKLASIIDRSRSHVLKLFQQHMNMSAKAFIMSRQMREARELLVNSTLAVSTVGRMAGFPDPYHFSKVFKQVVGQSPKEFREDQCLLPPSRRASSHDETPPPSRS